VTSPASSAPAPRNPTPATCHLPPGPGQASTERARLPPACDAAAGGRARWPPLAGGRARRPAARRSAQRTPAPVVATPPLRPQHPGALTPPAPHRHSRRPPGLAWFVCTPISVTLGSRIGHRSVTDRSRLTLIRGGRVQSGCRRGSRPGSKLPPGQRPGPATGVSSSLMAHRGRVGQVQKKKSGCGTKLFL
jgi:hypothetical protein